MAKPAGGDRGNDRANAIWWGRGGNKSVGAGMSTGHASGSNALPLRLMLSFTDPAYEKAFVKHYTEFYCRFAQASIGSGIVLLFGDFLVDFLVFPDISANFLRVLICIPFLAAVLAYSFTRHAKTHWQAVMAACTVIFAFSLFWVLQEIEAQDGMGIKSWVGILNFTFLEFYCFIILGVQFRYALVSGALILLAFEAAVWSGFGMQPRAFAYWSYQVVTLFILPLGIGWWREFLLRTEFSVRTSLEESRQMAERLTDIKSNFLSAMSHEIRTPMNAIIGMSHLALQMELQPKQRNYIDKVNRSAENLLSILNDILDFSKIEAGKSTFEAVGFRLEDVMDDLASLVGFKAEEKGLEFLLKMDPAIPTALIGDPLRLGQVLLNLADNAVKFTDCGEVIVGIESVAQTGQDVELHFWVRDSGIGITAQQQGELFQSFTQADISVTRKYGGSGLGLVISKQFVELMGGRIWIESEYGNGATFHFRLRFGLQPEPMPPRMPGCDELAGLGALAIARQKLEGARLLLVEDNELNRELALEILRGAGMNVVLASNGQEALEILAQDSRFDGVLMDCQMPVMDGYSATREIRKNPLFTTLPIIAMTAGAMSEDRIDVLGAGMSDHISKPFNVNGMFATLALWIRPAHPVADTAAKVACCAPTQRDPFDVPGIDTRDGLARALNNQSFYCKLLVTFRDSQGGFAEIFRLAQQDADPAAAARAAHSLSGAAANIGAKGVCNIAGRLESACQASSPQQEVDALLIETLEALRPVIGHLAGLEERHARSVTVEGQAIMPVKK